MPDQLLLLPNMAIKVYSYKTNLDTLYSASHAGLTWALKKYPQFADSIVPAQKVLIALDLTALLNNYNELYTFCKRDTDKKDSPLPYVKAGIVAVACSALSIYVVNVLNRKMIPPVNLTGIMKTLSNVKQLSWSMPWSSYAIQCILANRIALNLLLTCFSSQDRISHLSTAAFQSLDLITSARLPWIRMDITYPYYWSSSSKISPTNATFEFLLPSYDSSSLSCTSATSHFETCVKSIYKFSSHFFDNCRWEAWKETTTKRGIITNIRYFYKAFVHAGVLEACSCLLTPYFNGASANASSGFGFGDVAFTYEN